MNALRAEAWLARGPLDRTLLAAFGALLAAGLVMALAAGPSAAARYGYEDPFALFYRHAVYAAIGLAVMLAAAQLSARAVWALGGAVFAGALCLTFYAALAGETINGARRWVWLAGVSVQPAELLKPGWAAAIAWALGAPQGRFTHPGGRWSLIALMTALPVAALLMQPDFGQSALLLAVLAALVFAAGAPLGPVAALGASLAGAAAAALALLPHARARVTAFLNPDAPGNYQTAKALEAVAHGGLTGRGPGEGVIKNSLPDAHSDFIMAVAIEEYGLAALIIALGLLAAIAWRALSAALRASDARLGLAVTALALLLAGQGLLHLAVNLRLAPAKGLTMPFISAGGSSLIGASLCAGMMLALLRAAAAGDRRTR